MRIINIYIKTRAGCVAARVFRHAIRYFIRVTPLFFSFLVRAQFAYFMPTAVDTYALLKRKTHYVLKQYHAARTIFSTYVTLARTLIRDPFSNSSCENLTLNWCGRVRLV